MKRTVSVLVCLLLPGLAGCPDRKEVIDQVGGAPAQQVDIARQRIDKAEANLQKQGAAADAVAAPE